MHLACELQASSQSPRANPAPLVPALFAALQKHPNADRLLVLTVDIGEESPRTIVAGIANKFSPEELVGRQVVVVANLKPAKLRGIESQGMLLAAGGKEVIDLVSVNAAPGSIVR